VPDDTFSEQNRCRSCIHPLSEPIQLKAIYTMYGAKV